MTLTLNKPQVHRVFLRTSDNVLTPDDWGITVAYICDGYITKLEDVKDSAYASDEGDPSIGWDLYQLAEWLNMDTTGEYPETYNQIKFTLDTEKLPHMSDNQEWYSWLSAKDLKRLLP